MRVFHYFHHPFWGTTIFGNTHCKNIYFSGFPPQDWELWKFKKVQKDWRMIEDLFVVLAFLGEDGESHDLSKPENDVWFTCIPFHWIPKIPIVEKKT